MLCSSMQEVILHSHNCSIILKHSRTLLFDILVTYHACRSTITLKCSLVPMSSQVLLTLVVLFCYFLLFFFETNCTPSGKKTVHDFQTCCCTSIHLRKPDYTVKPLSSMFTHKSCTGAHWTCVTFNFFPHTFSPHAFFLFMLFFFFPCVMCIFVC